MCVVIASSPTHFSYFRIPFRHLKCHSGIEIPFRRKNFEKIFKKNRSDWNVCFGLECMIPFGMSPNLYQEIWQLDVSVY